MNITQHPKFLCAVLRLNGGFSTVSGLTMLLAARPLAQWIGLAGPGQLLGVGISLLLFALGLFRLSYRSDINPKAVRAIIAMDVSWVLLTAVLIAFGVFNRNGNALAIVLAAIVAWLARLQAIGLRKLESES